MSEMESLHEIRVNGGGARRVWQRNGVSPGLQRAAANLSREKPPKEEPVKPAVTVDVPAPTTKPANITVKFRDYAGMVASFVAIKDRIAISNDDLDALCNFGSGHTDKLLGPTSVRGFARLSLDAMLWALCIEASFTLDMDRVKDMEQHWERRHAGNTHAKPNRISKKIIKAARREVLKENGRLGGMVRGRLLSSMQAIAIAKKAAKARSLKLSKDRRREIASKAGIAGNKARWSNSRKGSNAMTANHDNSHINPAVRADLDKLTPEVKQRVCDVADRDPNFIGRINGRPSIGTQAKIIPKAVPRLGPGGTDKP